MLKTPEEAGWERVGPRTYRFRRTGETYEFPPTHPHFFINQMDRIDRMLDVIVLELKGLPVMQQQISDLLGKVATLQSAVNTLVTDTATEVQTINDLNAKLQAGTALGPDDVQALADAANTISTMTSNLQTAAASIPAPAAAAASAAQVPNPCAGDARHAAEHASGVVSLLHFRIQKGGRPRGRPPATTQDGEPTADHRPPDHVIAERDHRLSLPQTIDQALMGTPAPGRSAYFERYGREPNGKADVRPPQQPALERLRGAGEPEISNARPSSRSECEGARDPAGREGQPLGRRGGEDPRQGRPEAR